MKAPTRATLAAAIGGCLALIPFVRQAEPDPSPPAASGAVFTCPMHPSVRSASEGACPMCRMDLVEMGSESGVVIDTRGRQLVGIEVEPVSRRDLTRSYRAFGEVTADPTRVTVVAMRSMGEVGELFVTATGDRVERGDPLFSFYSNDLLYAQRQYIRDHRLTTEGRGSSTQVEASAEQLLRLDVLDEQLARIREWDEARLYFPIAAPASGVVVAMSIHRGAALHLGMEACRIVDLAEVWVEADVPEVYARGLTVGEEVGLELRGDGDVRNGKVVGFEPRLDRDAWTREVRVAVGNVDGRMLLGAPVDVAFPIGREGVLALPVDAVVPVGGDRYTCFVEAEESRFEPRRIEVGLRTPEWVEVTGGLGEEDRVVTRGVFFVASECRLRGLEID